MFEFEMTGGPTALTQAERSALERLESKLTALARAESQAGFAFREIKERGLWREEYLTFAEYCDQRWNRSRQAVNRLVAHADLVDEFKAAEMAPPKYERQSRPLVGLTEQERADVYERVQAHGGWEKTGGRVVERIAREVAPREVKQSKAMESPVVVVRNGKPRLSPRAKTKVLRELDEMAEEADATIVLLAGLSTMAERADDIQAMGPYLIEDVMKAWTDPQRRKAQASWRRVNRLLAAFQAAALARGADWDTWHEEDGGQIAFADAA